MPRRSVGEKVREFGRSPPLLGLVGGVETALARALVRSLRLTVPVVARDSHRVARLNILINQSINQSIAHLELNLIVATAVMRPNGRLLMAQLPAKVVNVVERVEMVGRVAAVHLHELVGDATHLRGERAHEVRAL